MNQSGLSDLIQKYQKTLAVNPNSRVFAPLADCFRRAGMIDEALEVLKKGIKENPDYLLGYLGLAQCYYDIKQYQAGYTLLRPYTDSNKDNLKLQRVFASLCLKLDFHEEALDAYKYILFMNPSDAEAGGYVAEFEDQVMEKKVTQKKQRDFFPVSKLKSDRKDASDEDTDEWVALDLSSYKEKTTPKSSVISIDHSSQEQWQMERQSSPERMKDEISVESVEDTNDRKFIVLNTVSHEKQSSQPLITHTLVDLYCAQGHFEKAYDLLQKILELNPDDEKTKSKLDEIKEFLPQEDFQENDEPVESIRDGDESENEEQAHERLMSLVESKVMRSNSSSVQRSLEEKLWLFYDKVKQKAEEKSLPTSD